MLFLYIYILSVFTDKSYSKKLERNVVYIPVITLSHAAYDLNDVKINRGSLSLIGRRRRLDVIDAFSLLAEKNCVKMFYCFNISALKETISHTD